MPGENCLLCASDEGIFLDIVEQPALESKAKNCRLEKVLQNGLSTKVCHKCAFEIEQCNFFVEKVRKANRAPVIKKNCCILCFDIYCKNIFFDLTKQKVGISNLVHKIQELFPDELKQPELPKQLICLSCRYCVDLLVDLRHLSDENPTKLQTIIQNGIDPADLPKTRTSIVSRKTTFLQSSNLDLNTPSDTDSDCSSIMSNRKKINKVNKTLIEKSQRKCQQCKTEVKNGIDMYKIYRTGVTVCKQCWLTIDPGKTKTPSKKRKKIDYSETKLCSVLLEDVYTKNSNEREYKIEKDNKGNTLFIVTDDSENESTTKRKTSKTKSNEEVDKQNNENIENTGIKKTKPVKAGRKKDEADKSIKSIDKRKELEQNANEEIEIKSILRNKRHKDSETSTQENIETKPIRSGRRRKESEESNQEVDNKIPTKLSKTLELTIEENAELKITRRNQRRKESEGSLQDAEVRSTRSTRNRKDSEQSIPENIEIKSTRSGRLRKESEQSSQESESKSIRSNKNRRDSEHSSQESIVIVSSKETRRRKESEQSAQEDIEVNVDIDSDSAPVFKKAKRSYVKIDSMPKQNQSKVSNQNNATSEDLFIRKRGRSSSLESTGSIRKSTRNAKKNVQELEEIIEIDDDTSSFKLQKENVLLNEDTLMHESTRSRRDRIVSYDEHSDTESNVSDIKVSSKRSSSVSSKESNSITKFKTPPNKDIQENIHSESLKSNKFLKLRKLEVGKPDDVESLKSIEVDTSESEEIDVLKSTDEETKDDSIEIECEEKEDNLILNNSLKESESAEDDDLKSDKEIIEPVDDELTTSIDVDNLKSTEDNLDSTIEVCTKTPSELIEKNSKFNTESDNSDVEESTKLEIKEPTKFKRRSNMHSIKQDPLASVTEDSQMSNNKSIAENIVKNNISDIEKDTIAELENDNDKEIDIADFNDSEVNLSEDNSSHSMSESTKEEISSKKRLNTSHIRKSKAYVKKSKKIRNKKITNDIHHNSNSETTNNEHTELIYTCTICDKIYENKFIGLQHELSHMKTLEIKLQKVQFQNAEKKQGLDELEVIELEVSPKGNSSNSNTIDETVISNNIEEKNENNIKIQKQIVEKENDENKIVTGEEDQIKNDNEQDMNESSIKEITDDVPQINKVEEKCIKINDIIETIEENGKANGEAIINDTGEDKIECSEIKEDHEVEVNNRRSTRRLSKKVQFKNDRKSRGKRKDTNSGAEEIVTTAIIEAESDKIAEAVQETLNDMAELHGKIKESSPVKVPEINDINKPGEQESEHEIELSETKIDNDTENERIVQSTENEECGDAIDITQGVISKNNKEESTCENINSTETVESDLETLGADAKSNSFKETIFLESDGLKETNEKSDKVLKMDDTEVEPIDAVNDMSCDPIGLLDSECKLSKIGEITEAEELVDTNENTHVNKSSVDLVAELNDEFITQTDISAVNKASLEKNDSNDSSDSKTENVVDDLINEDDGNNTEDEEALAQESLEELLQRKGLQIIDEFAESVTDGDDESEKDISSEKENVPDKDIELDNELQIKISDAECTEILEANKSLSKQKEVDQNVVGESQIIQDVDVVEEVINDDEQPHNDVVQEVEVESNGNCVNVANNVVGQVLTEVFNMATIDLAKRLELQTEPISDEEIVPETLENISREIRNSQDMPSLDPIDE